jgi:hypothetical protein
MDAFSQSSFSVEYRSVMAIWLGGGPKGWLGLTSQQTSQARRQIGGEREPVGAGRLHHWEVMPCRTSPPLGA